MFTQYSVNELISRFNKASRFIFSLLLIAIITSSFATDSYAETKVDKDSKVRKAVINQLLILGGKSKQKEDAKGAGQDKKDSERAEVTAEQSITSKDKLTEKKEAKPIKATIQSVVTSSSKSTKKPKEKKQKLAQPILNKAKKKQSTAIAIKPQATPLVDVLSDDEMQALMSDFMQSPDAAPELQATSSKLPPSQPSRRINASSKEQSADNSDKPESQIIPVERTRLGRNTAAKAPAKILTGWIYLGHFAENKWENQTLDVDQLPEIGKHYAVKATMVNLRATLPKKGVMGKAIKVIKNKVQLKIIQLRGLGRNREHYWARIER